MQHPEKIRNTRPGQPLLLSPEVEAHFEAIARAIGCNTREAKERALAVFARTYEMSDTRGRADLVAELRR